MLNGAQLLLSDLSNAFLHDRLSSLSDVTLQSSDARLIRTCRAILAARSPFFHKLLFSNFKEASCHHVHIDLRGAVLADVVEYLVTGANDTFRNAGHHNVADILELSHAADFIDCDGLFDDCMFSLRGILQTTPALLCTIAEATLPMQRCSASGNGRRLLLDTMIDAMFAHPTECFGVSDCVWRHAVENDVHNADVDDIAPAHQCVNILGFDAFERLIQASNESASPIDQEYLVLVIYYWAYMTNFRVNRERQFADNLPYWQYVEAHCDTLREYKCTRAAEDKQDDGNDDNPSTGSSSADKQAEGNTEGETEAKSDGEDTECSRAAQATKLLDYVKSSHVRPTFIRRVMEPMRLARIEKLSEMYRTAMIRSRKFKRRSAGYLVDLGDDPAC